MCPKDLCVCKGVVLTWSEAIICLELQSPSVKTRLLEVNVSVDPALGVATVVQVVETDKTQSIVRVTGLKKEAVADNAFKAFKEVEARCKKEKP